MEKMKELYEKVAADSTLQAKFAEIMNDAESAGKEETEVKLLNFAKESGFDISTEEMIAFFSEKSTNHASELNDAELDMVAGGKSLGGSLLNGLASVASGGLACIAATIITAALNTNCADTFEGIAKA